MRGIWLPAIILFAGASLAISLVGCTPTGSGGSGQGFELVKSKCTMCHSLDRVTQANKDRSSWDQTVARMRSKGAVMTDAEASQIAEYLSQPGATK